MADLIHLMSQLTDSKGNILVPGVMDSVAALTDDEAKLYDNIDFDTEQYRNSIGATQLAHNGDKHAILMHRWRYPSLSLHGIEGAAYQPGGKTVIPGKVIGKFSIRLVPDQTPEKIQELVYDYLNKKFAERKSPNKLTLSNQGGRPWIADPTDANYRAAIKATNIVYQTEPNMTREGGSIPVTLTLQEASQRNVLLLPMGAGDDMAHSQNEKINVRNYIEGTKLMAAYFHELSVLD